MPDKIEGICLCHACHTHLYKSGENTVPHISKPDTFYHDYCEPASNKDFATHCKEAVAKAKEQSSRSEPVVIHEIPARAHKFSQWTSEGYERLEADFINIFGEEL